LDAVPARHTSDVLCLSFGPWRAGSGAPILLASGSRDRSVMLFRIDVRRGKVGVEASLVTMLLQIPGHVGAIHSVSVLSCPASAVGNGDSICGPGSKESFSPITGVHGKPPVAPGITRSSSNGGLGITGTVQLAVCTVEGKLVLRDVELSLGGSSTVFVRRAQKQVARGSRWVDLCTHPVASCVLYAACSDRRIIQFDTSSNFRVRQQVKLAGGLDSELSGPLCISGDGQFLAVSLAPAAAKQQARQNSSGSTATASPLRGCAPGPVMAPSSAGAGTGVLLMSADDLQPLARFAGHVESPCGVAFVAGEPQKVFGCWPDGSMFMWNNTNGKKEGATAIRCASKQSTDDHITWIATPQRRRPPKPQVGGFAGVDASPSARCPESLLEKLLASSPKPPRWAQDIATSTSRMSSGINEDSMHFGLDAAFGTSLSVGSVLDDCDLPTTARESKQPCTPLGKWSRGSMVGAQVQSTSDLHTMVRDSVSSYTSIGSTTPREREVPKKPNVQHSSCAAPSTRGHTDTLVRSLTRSASAGPRTVIGKSNSCRSLGSSAAAPSTRTATSPSRGPMGSSAAAPSTRTAASPSRGTFVARNAQSPCRGGMRVGGATSPSRRAAQECSPLRSQRSRSPTALSASRSQGCFGPPSTPVGSFANSFGFPTSPTPVIAQQNGTQLELVCSEKPVPELPHSCSSTTRNSIESSSPSWRTPRSLPPKPCHTPPCDSGEPSMLDPLTPALQVPTPCRTSSRPPFRQSPERATESHPLGAS